MTPWPDHTSLGLAALATELLSEQTRQIEPEIACVLKHELRGPGVTVANALSAIAGVLPARRAALMDPVEALRAERNTGSKQIGQLMREGKRAEGQAAQARMSAIGDEIAGLDKD